MRILDRLPRWLFICDSIALALVAVLILRSNDGSWSFATVAVLAAIVVLMTLGWLPYRPRKAGALKTDQASLRQEVRRWTDSGVRSALDD